MEEKIANVISLFRADYTVSLHMRAMATLLHTSHMTLLPYLQSLEELRILKSEKIGKNKQYSLNKDNILTKYYLVAAEEQITIDYLQHNFLIKKLTENLGSLDVSSSLLLFGSHMKGYADEESDIDLFAIGKFTEKQQNSVDKFEAVYGKRVNVKNASLDKFGFGLRSGDILIKEVVANHIVICNVEPFVSLLWRHYVE